MRKFAINLSLTVNVEQLLPFPDIDPVAFALGPFVLRWYALAYLAGVGLGLLYGMSLTARASLWPNNKPPFTSAELVDFAFWAVIGIILGGRMGYVVFYNPIYFAQNPLEALQIWQGGMSFHGGMLGLIVTMYLFGRSKGANFLSTLDLLGCVTTIGLLLGRLSNFINGELYGRETSLPWGVVFPGAGDLPRHPSQLYEAALEGLVLFVIIRIVTHVGFGLRRPGLVAGIFGVGYALSRILVEFVRLPDVQIGYLYGGWLTLGMVLTVPLLLAGLSLIAYALRPRNAL